MNPTLQYELVQMEEHDQEVRAELATHHEVGHHIHRLDQPGYRADKEGVADEW